MRTRMVRSAIVLIISLAFLPGCADVATNMAMTGAQAVYNQRSLQKRWSDQYISMRVFKALDVDDTRFKDANISIATFNNEVLLAGQVPKSWQRQEAEQRVKDIPNVKRVYNLIAVTPPSSALTRISDAWITAKVKAKLMTSSDVDATQVKVVTEDGTVYLMGILLPSEAQAAVDMARTTEGVEKVVKVFSYLRISRS
ncbi:MAG: BON domain-containing protein [Gammaproteobacteria bacterium]|nr:MAG: BON domain-containing protein [Gammaproteobacteria bacterium]